jgi:response regulator RpfG family c-di-GMP phosphodiesterase
MSTASRIGAYEILALIAKGNRAAVYRALDNDTGRQVAIKIIKRSALNAAALPEYRTYASALARLEHPAIVPFFDLVENDKAIGLVSDLCEGKAISGLLKEDAHPELKNVWDIVRPVLEGLGEAHAKGLAHRDVKPANLFLAPDGTVRLTDWGSSVLLATPVEEVHYRAPEQYADPQASGPRTDVYQAGVLVYQLVTGKLPFTGTPGELESRVLGERPADPSSHNNRIAWQLDFVLQRALAKVPAERFLTAIEFAEGLRLGLQETIQRPLDLVRAPGTVKATPAAATAGRLAGVVPVQTGTQSPPATAPAPTPTNVATVVPADNGKPKVLFVDDDERIVNALRALFRQEYQVFTATSGEAALEIVNRGGLQVVVSDQRMPGLTGVELLRKVREIQPNAVRMLLTGYADLQALVGSINEGEIFRYVKKPWDNDELRKDMADAVQASASNASAKPVEVAGARSAGSLLVIDPKEGLGRGLERLLAGEAHVIQVASPAEAAKALAANEIAAIVADMGAGMDGLVALFKQVKAKRPGVLTILLADEPDSELGIELINKAHIFRFLPKPVSAKDLRHQVAEALRRYAAFKAGSTLTDDGDGGGTHGAAAPSLARSA